MRILVIGGGAREHACVAALLRSPQVERVYWAPGNPGAGLLAENVPITVDSPETVHALARWAWHERIDLAIVGPQLPLRLGVVDEFHSLGLPICGPTQAAAEIATSRAWARDFMARHSIPGPAYQLTTSFGDLLAYLGTARFPLALQPEGAGKGVLIVHSREEAEAGLQELVRTNVLGPGRETVVCEEIPAGREVSAMCFTDGKMLWPMPPVRVYRPLEAGDAGPLTEGMGAYSPAQGISDELWREVAATILWPAVAGLAAEDRPFQGFLCARLRLTDAGPQVTEFQAGLGDPEAQVLLPRLESDFLALVREIVQGRLGDTAPTWSADVTCGVVLAAEGYPGPAVVGQAIGGLGEMQDGMLVFHGGTALASTQTPTIDTLDAIRATPLAGLTPEEAADLLPPPDAPRPIPFLGTIMAALAGPKKTRLPDIDTLLGGTQLVTAGGRVLTLVARGATLAEARTTVYRNVARIQFLHMQVRPDVGSAED